MTDVRYEVDAAFPGGNIIVERLEKDVALIRPDLRDTEGGWFYWCFRVRGAQGRRLQFQFTQQSPIGSRGPAISLDGGDSWRWLGRGDGTTDSTFSHAFGPDDRDVLFGMGMTYTQRHFDRFMEALPGRHLLKEQTLCDSRKGRTVQAFTLGDATSADHRIIVTARHHCCEMMANYELEGLLAAMTGPDELGRWYQQHVAAFVVPFVDKDGVEDGDQGKNRRPRDHNRDYDGQSAHLETAALRACLPQWLSGRPLDVFLDLHCPWIRGGINEITYQVGSSSAENWREQQLFGAALEKSSSGAIPYLAENDLPFGKDWNIAANVSAGVSSTRYGRDVLHARLSTTIEFPYANSSGAEVNADSARRWGCDVAWGLRSYLQAR